MSNEIVLTAEGLEKIKTELEYLKTTRRAEVIEMIAHARSLGDLSENSEYDEAREEQGRMESRIVELENIIKNSKVIDVSEFDASTINVGDHVKVYDTAENEECEYDIVGPTEADIFLNRISDQSPIGKAIIGSRVGDEVTVEAPNGDFVLKILDFTKNS